jgi:methyl-accepting chemotaxis protein
MFGNVTIKAKLIFVIGFLSVLLIAIGFLGLRGMGAANENMGGIYKDRLLPTAQLATINELMQANVRLLLLASMHDPRMEESKLHDHPIARHTEEVEKNIAIIGKKWDDYMSTSLTPEEKKLADSFSEKRGDFVKDGLKPAIVLYNQEKFAEANTLVVKVINPAFTAAKADAEKLIQLQVNVAKEVYDQSEAAYITTRMISIASIVLGVLLAVFIGFLLIRTIGASLRAAGSVASRIAAGDLSSTISISQNDEIGQLLQHMNNMQESL